MTNRNTLFSILLIIFVALLSLTWFKGDFNLSGTDLYLPHDRLTFFNISLQTWDDRGLGSDNFRMLAIPLPYGAYLALTQVVGLNIVTTQKIWFYLMYVLTGISMYLLSTLIVSNNKSISNKNTVSLIASLYYMINPFFAMMLASFPFAWHMYALLPLKLYIFARGLLYKKQVGYIFITTFIWVLLSSSIYVNSKNILFDVLLISIFVLLYIFLIAEKQEKIIALKYTSKYFIILFLLSSYWLLPAFFGISENFKAVEESYNALGHGGRLTTFQLNSANSIFDAFRQWGLWSAYESYKGEPYYYWSIFYKSSTAIVVSLFVILIALIPIFSKKLNKYLLIFYIVWCLSIVGMAGATFSQSQQIYEIINIQLVKYLPFFVDLFSVPYLFFGMYNSIALSLLFAIGLYISVKYLTKRHVKFEYVLYMLSVLVLLVYSMPIINGDVFRKDSTVMKGSRYEVPEYYHNAANYYNSQNLLSRTFPLPYSSQVYMSNNWDKGYTGFGIYHLLNKNVVYGVLDISTLTSKSINNADQLLLPSLLSKQNIRYVLIQNDANWEYYINHPWFKVSGSEDYINILESNECLLEDKRFGELLFYKVSDKCFLPLIYTASNFLNYDSSTIDMLSFDLNSEKSVVKYQQRDVDYLWSSNKPITKIHIEFNKESSELYKIKLHKAKGKAILVFSSQYNNNWKLKQIQSKGSSLSSINLNYHSNSDGLASEKEINEYIKQGLLTDVALDNSIKVNACNEYYISKSYSDSIQNNCINKTKILQLITAKDLSRYVKHIAANGYANSWVIEIDEMCKSNTMCVLNADGTYEIELILSYQKKYLYFFGIIISILTLLILLYLSLKNRLAKDNL